MKQQKQPMSKTIKQILLDAHKYLSKRELNKGAAYAYGDNGKVIACCVLGSIWKSNGSFSEPEAEVALMKHLYIHSLPQWNDEEERTKEDVLQALLDTANGLPE